MEFSRAQKEGERQATLSRVLKLLRRRRGLRSAEVARAMGCGLRTYQRFESGTFGLEFDRIFKFAEVVRADPWGIVFAVEFGSVNFALYCAENNAASLLLLMLRRFDRQAGKDIASLDPRSLVSIFAKAFDQISLKADEFDAIVEQWMFDESLGGDLEDDD